MKHVVRRGALLAAAASAMAAGPAVANHIHYGDAQDRAEYQEKVTVPRIVKHLEALQTTADRNGDTRASGTPGYIASVRYVVGQLRAAGYKPTVQAFTFPFFQETGPATVERISPSPKVYERTTEFGVQTYSGNGDATGQLQAVDVQVPFSPTPNSSTSGCEESDFDGFVAGNIALMQRGTCNFGVKAENAAAAGAVAVIIFNEGQPGREVVINGTAGAPQDIPVVDTSYALGAELVELTRQGPVTMRVATPTFQEPRRTYNVIADSTLGSTNRKTIVVGAHLDSRLEGPGIQDNGSGSAMILELARQLHRIGAGHQNRVRFAWWAAEENNLLGSTYYVEQLTPARLGDIKLNLNFDMVASPNGIRGVYDGNGDATDTGGPEGSAEIEQAFLDAFGDLPTKQTPFNGRSDYGPFIAEDIPAGGLFTGAEEEKTAEEAATFGGTAGLAYDPCYHQPCDDLANSTTPLGLELLDSNADAAAAVLFDYANADTLPGEE